MASGANDRRGLVQRIRDARRAYRGPFTGQHFVDVVSDADYAPAYDDGDGDAFLVFKKPGCRPIPINPDWDAIWDDDPIFRCLQRDLGLSRGELRIRLNRARNSTS